VPGPSKIEMDMGNALATVGASGVAGFSVIHNSGFTQFQAGTAIQGLGELIVAQGQWDNSHRFKSEEVFTPGSINVMSKGNPGWIYVTVGASGVYTYNPQTWRTVPSYRELVCVSTSKSLLNLSLEAGSTDINAWAIQWLRKGLCPGMSIENANLDTSDSPVPLEPNKILYAHEATYAGGTQSNNFQQTAFSSWGQLDQFFCQELYWFRAVLFSADYDAHADSRTTFLVPNLNITVLGENTHPNEVARIRTLYNNVGPTRGT